MRVFGISAVVLLSIVDLGWSQVDVPSSQTAKLPMYRPVLLGTGPDSLINRIDTAELIKKGQKDAAIMFSCLVAPTGDIVRSGAYRGTSGSKLLSEGVLKRLVKAKFIPAVHNHQPVIAVFYGTVTFAVGDGKPRLRSASNQQLDGWTTENALSDPHPTV